MIRLRAIVAVLVLPLAIGSAASAQQVPELTAPVNDFAGVIDPGIEAELDSLIRRLQTATGDVIVVATVKTFQPAADIRVYANEMFDNHGKGVGQKGRDNGMLVLLAVDDREVWNEVGYDLESIVTDGFAGATSRQTMRPHFRNGDYGRGLLAGVTVFAQRIAEARNVTLEGLPAEQPPASPPAGGGAPVIVMLFVAMLFINFIRGVVDRLTGRRRRRRWGSMVGPFGAGYGGWHAGRGGWRGGGGWSGGGGFGGGFGGFGGGRSGGGGGGASW